MAISAKDVNELRQATGLGMMECKKALEEVNGDKQAAMDLLRKKGLAKMNERSDRASAEGRVGAAVSADKTKAAIVEVNTETDFTANNDSFKAMVAKVAGLALNQPVGPVAKDAAIQAVIDDVRITTKENVQFKRGLVVGSSGRTIGSYVHFNGKVGVLVEVEGPATAELLTDLCMHVAAASPTPLGIRDEDVPAEVVAKEREIAKAQAIESGKPAQIAEKMVEGKIRKFYEDNTLLKQLFIKDDKKRVQDIVPKGVTVKSFTRYQVGGA